MNTRSQFLKRSLQVALLAAVSCVASAAVAGDAATQSSVTVRYNDLNLSHADGVQQLYVRIRAAAREVCGSARGTLPLRVRHLRQQCADTAVASAVKQVNNGILTAMHSGKKSSRRLG